MKIDIKIFVLLVIIGILLGGIILAVIPHQNEPALQIDSINLNHDSPRLYTMTGQITPLKNFKAIRAEVTFYNNDNVIIDKSEYAWTIYDVSKGTPLSLESGRAICEGTPSYAVITFYNLNDKSLANATITFT